MKRETEGAVLKIFILPSVGKMWRSNVVITYYKTWLKAATCMQKL